MDDRFSELMVLFQKHSPFSSLSLLLLIWLIFAFHIHSHRASYAKDGYRSPSLDLESGIVERPNITSESTLLIEPSKEETNLASFFEDVHEVKHKMEDVEELLKSMKKQSDAVMIASIKGKEAFSTFEQTNDQASRLCVLLKKKLDFMGKLSNYRREFTESEVRMHKTIHGSLVKRYSSIAKEYHTIQKIYRENLREKLTRQYKIAKPDAVNGDIEEAVEEGVTNKTGMFTQAHTEASKIYQSALEQNELILKLENSIMELHQHFVDLQIIVDEQGEALDLIEENVSKSVTYTGRAKVELEKANVYQKKSRKKMCILIICLLIVVIVVVVLLKVLKKF